MLIAGATPLVLVAPHGGRRDTARRPWGAAPLKVNDLHTAALTAELARVNLLQLFTRRYAGDCRSRVAALASMASAVDAVQLELGIPLRWPGPWRTRFVEACRRALPSLTAGDGDVAVGEPATGRPANALVPCRLQFAGVPFSGLAALGADGGARLLLLPHDGGLLLF